MANIVPPLGVSQVSALLPNSDALPTMLGVTDAFSVVTPTVYNRGSNKKAMSAVNDYNVYLAAFGMDQINGGYTFGIATAASGDQEVSAGQGVLCRVAAADIATATHLSEAVGIALFLQVGAATPQICAVGMVNAATDFSFLIMEEPYFSATKISAADLATPPATPTRGIGSRNASNFGTTPLLLTDPSSGGVREVNSVTTAAFRPDNSVNTDIKTSQAVAVEFNCLSDQLDFLMQAAGGDYVQYTDTNSDICYQGSYNNYVTTSNVPGNTALLVTDPPQTNGNFLNRLYTGNVAENQGEYTFARTKEEAPSVPLTLKPAALDGLLNGISTGQALGRNAA